MLRASLTVLHYTGYPADHGGIHRVIRLLAQQEPNWRVLLGVSADCRKKSATGPALWRGPAIRGEEISLANLRRAFVVALTVRRWLRRRHDRIFHGHSRAGLLVALWLRFMGEGRVAVTVHCYGSQRWFYRAAKKMLGPRLRWLTPAMQRYYYGPGAVGSWDDCVPNGLPGTPALEMRRWPGGRELRIGAAGMLTAGKNWDLIVDALNRLPARAPIKYFHLGGSVNDASSVRYAATLTARVQQEMPGRVHWLGWRESSSAFLREVDVVVVPLAHEAFSLIALEALFAGVPVIAARGGGPEDLIISGINGWLVAPDDAGALARQLQDCLEPGAWCGLQIERAHLRRFAIAPVTAQWRKIYAKLLGESFATPPLN